MKRMHRTLRWAVATGTILLAAALCLMCVDIYKRKTVETNHTADGKLIQSVFTREIVSESLSALKNPVIGYAVLVFASVSTGFKTPMENVKYALAPENRLRLLHARIDQLPKEAQAEGRRRKRLVIVRRALIAFFGLLIGSYFLEEEHFVSWDLETVMFNMLIHTLPWILLAFAASVVMTYVLRGSIERECKLLKKCKLSHPEKHYEKKQCGTGNIRLVILAIGAVFIIHGTINGGARDVLIKAINICTECIGLG